MKTLTVIDDHGCGTVKEAVVGVLGHAYNCEKDVHEDVFVCLLNNCPSYYTINRLYTDTAGKVHLSTNATQFMENGIKPVEQQIERFNEGQKNLNFGEPQSLRLATDEEVERFLETRMIHALA